MDRSQLGEYSIGGFLPGYLPARGTTREAPLALERARRRSGGLSYVIAQFKSCRVGHSFPPYLLSNRVRCSVRNFPRLERRFNALIKGETDIV